MFSDMDAHGNILRGAVAIFGAGLGGANSICALAFSQTQGTPNAFARRVARNMQHLLLQESHLWRVDDPAAGAGHVEVLTQRFCDEAWTVMRRCESGYWPEGNLSPAGVLPIVGVTKYQASNELPPEIEPDERSAT